jgi:mannitol-1-phosphate 5-dehydrogenase
MYTKPTMLIYGAWNIWRWFLADLWHQSWYSCVFVDVRNDIIEALNTQHAYNHRTVWAQWIHEKEIDSVRWIHWSNIQEVIQAINKTSLITTAVGKNALPYIIPTLQQWLLNRIKKWNHDDCMVTTIAFKNIHWNTDYLKSLILQWLSSQDQKKIMDHVQFPNSLVDRIVPNYQWENILDVCVEDYYQIAIDGNAVDTLPRLHWIQITKDLDALADQKLFTLNMGHALTAYLWNLSWATTIHDAIQNSTIHTIVHSTMREIGQLLEKKYPHTITQKAHESYVSTTIERFKNHYLNDTIDRVARDPIRKLWPQDRLVSPFVELFDNNIPASFLGSWIASALLYQNNHDPQAIQLQSHIKNHWIENVITEYLWITQWAQMDLISSHYHLRRL